MLSDISSGDQMKEEKYHLLWRQIFNESSLRPDYSCTGENDGGNFDYRCWEGRSEKAVDKKWSKLNLACTNFEEAWRILKEENDKVNTDEEQLFRCFTACFNAKQRGSSISSIVQNFVNICRNQNYIIGKHFFSCVCTATGPNKLILLRARRRKHTL